MAVLEGWMIPLLRRLALCNCSWASVVIPNYLTYGFKIESRPKVDKEEQVSRPQALGTMAEEKAGSWHRHPHCSKPETPFFIHLFIHSTLPLQTEWPIHLAHQASCGHASVSR